MKRKKIIYGKLKKFSDANRELELVKLKLNSDIHPIEISFLNQLYKSLSNSLYCLIGSGLDSKL